MSTFGNYQEKNGEIESLCSLYCVGSGERWVLHLTSDLFGKKHIVNFNNYFSIIPLTEYLLLNKVFGCATIQTIRKAAATYLKSNKFLVQKDFNYHL